MNSSTDKYKEPVSVLWDSLLNEVSCKRRKYYCLKLKCCNHSYKSRAEISPTEQSQNIVWVLLRLLFNMGSRWDESKTSLIRTHAMDFEKSQKCKEAQIYLPVARTKVMFCYLTVKDRSSGNFLEYFFFST